MLIMTISLLLNSRIIILEEKKIQEWIDIHKPEKYCIVDDDSDMLPHQNFVQTNSKIGLDYSSALVVCRFLNAT